jgi:hypothetical protein
LDGGVSRGEDAPPFVFSRQGRYAEPHVVVVPGRSALSSRHKTDGAEVVEIAYAGGGWEKFVARACAVFSLLHPSMRVFTERVFERALQQPLIVYVGNAKALLLDCPEELLHYVLFFEQFAFDRRDRACPMFLALQMPEQQHD